MNSILLLEIMSMKKILLFIVAICPAFVFAQDVIVKKDGTTILSKVLEVNMSDIKYKKFSNKKGPTYSINKSDIMCINYENGEKDVFDDFGDSTVPQNNISSQHVVEKNADQRNAELLSLYNAVHQASKRVKVKDKFADHCLVIFGLKSNSVISNEDLEIRFASTVVENPNSGEKEQRFYINIINKSNRIIYIDKGNCFRVGFDGKSFCYFDITEQTTINNGGGNGASIGLGSIAGALGIGGTVGQIADGVNVGGVSSHSASTTYFQQRVIAIPPHGNMNLTEDRWVKTKQGNLFSDSEYKPIEQSESIGFPFQGLRDEKSVLYGLPRGVVKCGEVKLFNENELPWKREYYITYSFNEDFRTYSTLYASFYIHEIIGGAGDWLDGWKNNAKYIENMNDYTISAYLYLEKTKK